MDGHDGWVQQKYFKFTKTPYSNLSCLPRPWCVDFCVAPRSFTPVVAKKRLGYKVRDGRMEKKRRRKESRGQEKSAGSSLRRVHAKKKITGEREGKAKEEGKSKGQAVPTSTLSLQALLPTHTRICGVYSCAFTEACTLFHAFFRAFNCSRS